MMSEQQSKALYVMAYILKQECKYRRAEHADMRCAILKRCHSMQNSRCSHQQQTKSVNAVVLHAYCSN